MKKSDMKDQAVNWSEALQPLFKEYEGRPHPLKYANRYQLIVMVILSAQSTDNRINEIAPVLFQTYPSMKELACAKPENLYQYISTVRGFMKKAKWLASLAKQIRSDGNIPTTLKELTCLPGIGRKSANVIIRELGGPAEGVIVDLHVVRVAPRLGIAEGTQPGRIERQLMQTISQQDWGIAGMAISFLGREICRPTDPKCPVCVMNSVCIYFASAA